MPVRGGHGWTVYALASLISENSFLGVFLLEGALYACLGMLMQPKTICYILLICAFLKATGKKQG